MLYRWRDQALAGLPGLFNDQSAQELAEKEAEWQKEGNSMFCTKCGNRLLVKEFDQLRLGAE